MFHELAIESMLANRNKVIRTICLMVCLGVLTVVLAYNWRGSQMDHQEQHLLASLPAVTLHSNRPYHEVRVSFRGRNGWIDLTASSSGKAIDCILDTGDAFATWPQALSLASTDAHFHYTQFTPYSYTRPRSASWRMLTDLKLGDYEMQDCASLAYDADTGDARQSRDALIIGYPALARIVLTIDYRKQELLFRDKTYDLTHLPAGPGIYLLNMAANPEDVHRRYRQPIVQGTIAGQRVNLILDTGLSWGGVVLANPKLISAIQQSVHGRMLRSWTTGRGTLPVTPWSIGNLAGQAPINLMPNFVSHHADGVVGYEVLRNYRITIDYERQKILLEWNPLNSASKLGQRADHHQQQRGHPGDADALGVRADGRQHRQQHERVPVWGDERLPDGR